MFSLLKGDCEHCGQVYRYQVLDASFSDCSYAYCDTCGRLAVVSYSSGFLVSMPRISTPHQVIDQAWEPFLRACPCGGHFRHNAAPRCPVCLEPLSPRHAAAHIERNFAGGGRGWHWQGNWSEAYCIDIEDPHQPGIPRQLDNPFLDNKAKAEAVVAERKGFFSRLFKA